MNQFRREFIKMASAVTAGVVISPGLYSNPQIPKAKTFAFCVFTKCLQFLDYHQMAETLVKIGFKGVELSELLSKSFRNKSGWTGMGFILAGKWL